MVHHDNSIHLVNYDVKNKKDLYYSSALRLFGANLVAIFLPAFLMVFGGYSLSQVFVFFAVTSFTIVLLSYTFIINFIDRLGTKICMLMSIPFLVIYFLGIAFINIIPLSYILIPIFGGIFSALFRTSFHYDMSRGIRNKGFAKQVAILHIIIVLVTSFAPLLGGYMLDNFNSNIVYFISVLFIVFSSIPLIHSYVKHKSFFGNTEKNFIKYVNKNIFSKKSITYFSKSYIGIIAIIIWPLYIYLFVKNFTNVGIISTLTTLVVVFLIYFFGKKPKKEEKKTFKYVSNIQFLNWLFASIIIFTNSMSGVFLIIIDIIHKFTQQINNTFVERTFYEISGMFNKSKLLNIGLHEVSIHIFRGTFCLLLAGLFYFIDNPKFIIIPIIMILAFIPFQSKILD